MAEPSIGHHNPVRILMGCQGSRLTSERHACVLAEEGDKVSEPLCAEAAESDMVALLTRHQSRKRFLAEVQDSDLIRSCQRGNLWAFEELVRRHRGKAYAVAYGIVRNRDDALDITQEAFIRAYRGIGKFRHQSSFATWFRRIVVNLSIDHLRRRHEGGEPPERQASLREGAHERQVTVDRNQLDGEDHVLRRELAEVMDWAMRKLAPQQRAAVILRDAEGLSYSEIARVMDCSKGTVMSRIHYGRQKLQTLLSSYLNSDSRE